VTAPAGYLRTIKTTATEALQAAFQVAYPETDPAGGDKPVYISQEYPVEKAHIPAIWVEFEPADLRTAGIAYTETDAQGNLYTRWRFSGMASFTIAAMSSNERDMIYDQMVALVAFASQTEGPSIWRQTIEASDLIATTWSYDTIDSRGEAAAPGTPWGTDEVMYERGIALQVLGEFVTNPITLNLVPLSEIAITMTDTGAEDTTSMIKVTRNAPGFNGFL
jgi:predicted secreted protein